MRPVLTLFGPTASGKSALALALAEALGGEIINADSRQVYRGVQLVTAGPTPEDRARIPHHLFDFLDVSETYSAGRWAEDAGRVIQEVQARGRVAIVVGGTGFYLKALTEGMGAVPAVPEAVTHELSLLPLAQLQAALAEADPVLHGRLSAKAELRNTQRVVRALAVARHTGTPLSVWQAQPGKPVLDAPFLKLALNPPVDILKHRMANRWHALVNMGVIEEVRALKEEGHRLSEPGLQGLAVPVFYDYLDSKLSLPEALHLATRGDAQYAKRQRTWLRTQYGAEAVFASGDIQPVMGYLQQKGLA